MKSVGYHERHLAVLGSRGTLSVARAGWFSPNRLLSPFAMNIRLVRQKCRSAIRAESVQIDPYPACLK
jgi:hypothetical protein